MFAAFSESLQLSTEPLPTDCAPIYQLLALLRIERRGVGAGSGGEGVEEFLRFANFAKEKGWLRSGSWLA